MKHAQFKICEMDAIENGEKYLLATYLHYGQTILLNKLLVSFVPTGKIVD